MSDSGERTEKASAKRKQDAREKGDIPHSRDLTSAAGMLAATLVLGAVGPHWAQMWSQSFSRLLDIAQPRSWIDTQSGAKLLALRAVVDPVLMPLGIMFIVSFTAVVLIGLAQNRGLQFSGEAIQPKAEKLNPANMLKQTFSLRGMTRMAKSSIPVIVLAWFVVAKVREQTATPVFSLERLPLLFGSMYGLMLDASAILFVWSVIDYGVEVVSWGRRLRMSKQEVREEFKQTEGSPEVRRRIASIRRQLRRKALRADISRASVVITNPTHYAVALQFDMESMEAPKLVAKGRDLIAAQIRDEARWAGIPLVENPPLARALYRQVEVGQSIPFSLYAAVAAILAWLYRREVEDRMRKQQAEVVRRQSVAAADAENTSQGSAPPASLTMEVITPEPMSQSGPIEPQKDEEIE